MGYRGAGDGGGLCGAGCAEAGGGGDIVHQAKIAVVRALLCMLASASYFCHASPNELPIQLLSGAQPIDAREIADYPRALDAVLRVMVQKFNLPLPRGKVEIHSTREGFERALITYLKIAPSLARSTAQFARAAVGSNTLLINEQALAGFTWPQRMEEMAHELTHILQLTLANRSGINGNQWLIEGFAEWMAFNITDVLGLDSLAQTRARLIAKVRELKRKGELPALLRLDSFADWVATRQKTSFDGTYSQSFLITDFLIERHTLVAVVDYFRRYEKSDDHHANFKAVFGEDLDDFGRALDRHMDRLLN
ncbi:MAG: hypothetical protein ABL891_05660 [Burkholderiales bacterium]